MATRRATQDEQFNKRYEQYSAAPPSTGGISSARKVRKTNRSLSNTPPQQTTYEDNVRKTRIKKTPPNTPPPEPQYNYGIAGRRVRRFYTKRKMEALKKPGKKANLKDRAKVTSVNMGIWSWAIPLWLVFQVPFALINNLLFGLASVELAITEGVEKTFEEGDDGALIEGTKTVFRFLGNVVKGAFETLNDVVAYLSGFDFAAAFSGFLPSSLYMFTFSILFAYALILLGSMLFIYQMARINALFGQGASSKVMLFLLCIIGYILPLVNMVPWFLFWNATVWRYPK